MENKIIDYLTSDYIFLPYYNDMKVLVNDKEYIYKNELILDSDKKKINSSVSGNILGVTTIEGKKYIVIENDFKDKLKTRKGSKKYINRYTKDELNSMIKEYSLIDDFDIDSKVLIISGIDEYKDEITYKTLLDTYTIEILDAIDALIDIMNIKKCVLAIDNSDTSCINKLYNTLGTYPKIDLKLFNYDYSIGIRDVLLKKIINHKSKNYKVLYLNIKEVLNIYSLLKKGRPLSETYLTLTGNKLNYKKVLMVKIGTNLTEIINNFKLDKDNIIINGLLNGIKVTNTNFIIDNKVRSIFVNTMNNYNQVDCINCGLCLSNCPININPKYMCFNNDKKAEYYKKKCINCGICSYVCPSKIELTKEVKNDKK